MTEALFQPFPLLGSGRAQIWRYAPAYRRPRHFHAEPELNLVCSGSGSFGFGDRVVAVSSGDLLWWPPGQDHELLEASPDFDLFVIGATPAFCEQVLGWRSGAPAGASLSRLPPAELERWRRSCAAPLGEQDSSVMERHVGDLWRAAQAAPERRSSLHTLTRRTLDQLLHEPDLERFELASAAQVDPSDVSRYFRRDTGLTLTTYRTRLRLLRFIAAVERGAPSLLSAAGTAGFGSYSQCHRAFCHTLGCTPRAFFRTPLGERMKGSFAPR